MAVRHTGPGKLQSQVKPAKPFPFAKHRLLNRVLLYNFDFDSAELKPEFREALDRIGRTLLEGTANGVWTVGTASRIGNADYNWRLGYRRARNVYHHLAFRSENLDKRSILEVNSVGETQASAFRRDSEFDRAVQVFVFRAPDLPEVPPPPRPAEPSAMLGHLFSIQMRKLMAATLGPAEVLLGLFRIVHEARGAHPGEFSEYSWIAAKGNVGLGHILKGLKGQDSEKGGSSNPILVACTAGPGGKHFFSTKSREETGNFAFGRASIVESIAAESGKVFAYYSPLRSDSAIEFHTEDTLLREPHELYIDHFDIGPNGKIPLVGIRKFDVSLASAAWGPLFPGHHPALIEAENVIKA